MSKSKIPYEKAKRYADRIVELLEEHCIKIEIAGSIRRRKETVGDIEIVCIPKPYDTGLFASGIAPIVNKWQKVKGELPCKYTQRILPGGEGIKVDIFFATEINWGLILAIRTGSEEFSKTLAYNWSKQGYKSEKGMLWKDGKSYNVPTEKALFERICMKYVHPVNRK